MCHGEDAEIAPESDYSRGAVPRENGSSFFNVICEDGELLVRKDVFKPLSIPMSAIRAGENPTVEVPFAHAVIGDLVRFSENPAPISIPAGRVVSLLSAAKFLQFKRLEVMIIFALQKRLRNLVCHQKFFEDEYLNDLSAFAKAFDFRALPRMEPASVSYGIRESCECCVDLVNTARAVEDSLRKFFDMDSTVIGGNSRLSNIPASNSRMLLFDWDRNVLISHFNEAPHSSQIPLHGFSAILGHVWACVSTTPNPENSLIIDDGQLHFTGDGFVRSFEPRRPNHSKTLLLPPRLQDRMQGNSGLTENDGEIYLYSDGHVFRKSGGINFELIVNLRRPIDSLCVIGDSETRFHCVFACFGSGEVYSATVTAGSEPRFELLIKEDPLSSPHVIGHYKGKVCLSFFEGSLIAVMVGEKPHRVILGLRGREDVKPSVSMLENKIYVRGDNIIYVVDVETGTIEENESCDLALDVRFHPRTYLIREYNYRKERFRNERSDDDNLSSAGRAASSFP